MVDQKRKYRETKLFLCVERLLISSIKGYKKKVGIKSVESEDNLKLYATTLLTSTGLTTVRNHMFKKREKIKEVYVRQVYEPGQRFEFDFGEVYLYINDTKQKYYLAVMSSPYSNYRTAYLYVERQIKSAGKSRIKIRKKLRFLYLNDLKSLYYIIKSQIIIV